MIFLCWAIIANVIKRWKTSYLIYQSNDWLIKSKIHDVCIVPAACIPIPRTRIRCLQLAGCSCPTWYLPSTHFRPECAVIMDDLFVLKYCSSANFGRFLRRSRYIGNYSCSKWRTLALALPAALKAKEKGMW